jgi:tRNA A37 threonylcarbamoyladenosine synthetase subunit TsaC/SUA5/YrdC
MINLSWQNSKNRQDFVKILQSEGIIAGSTDTVLGLFAPLTSNGYTQLNEIKQRNYKPYLVMVANFDKALSFVDPHYHEKLDLFAQKYWP